MKRPLTDIGLIGLGVMGSSLALNIVSHGYSIAVHNRSRKEIDELINGRGKGKNIIGCEDIVDFVNSIKKPRKVMLMVVAGSVIHIYINT